MAKIALSSSQILNIALGAIIVVGSLASVKYSNFGGVSFDELGEKYISKSDVKFSDLPQDMQKHYIDKEATIEQGKDGNLYEDEYFDENGKPIPDSELTPQDFKRMINKLQKTLLFVQHDNLLMANEKNELSKKLEEQDNELEEQRNQLTNKNTERLNEAEQQHYRNISDLTTKINEVQKENVIIAQKANIEANTLRGQIEELKAKAVEDEDKKRIAIQKAREEEQSKLTDYKEKIKFLNDQIALLNEQINTNNDTAKNAFTRKQDEINKLKEEIVQAAKEKNELLNKQTQTILLSDQKHKEEIGKYSAAIEQLKTDTEKLIAKNRQDMALQDDDHLKKMAQEEEKIKGLNNEIASSKKHIDALMLENEKDFNKFKTYLEDEKKLNKELTAANKKLEENAQNSEKNLNVSIQKLNEEIAKREVMNKELSDKIVAMNSEKLNVEEKVKKRVDENDKIHNKNYKAFNEKLANFDNAKKELIAKFDKQLSEYKATAQENSDRMQFHANELTTSNNDLKLKNDEKEKELQSLKTQIVTYRAETQKGKESDDGKIKELRAALDELKASSKAQESDYLAKIQLLQADIKEKETAIVSNRKDEVLKIAALEKEIKSKALELQKIQTDNARNEGMVQTLHVKLKDAEDNATKATNKKVEELKAQLATIEKNRVSEDSKMVGLKDELRRKEIEYLDVLKEKDKEIKTKEATILATKEGIKKIEGLKASTDENLTKFKEESKQKELQYLEATKTLQTEIKAKEAQLTASSKDETLKSIALDKELKAKEAQILGSKEEMKKLEAQRVATEDKLAKLKEESKQQQLQNLEATKVLQAELKAKESHIASFNKEETLKSIALEKELKAKEATIVANKENYKKTETLKASLEENITKLKEEFKQKELQYLEAAKALQADIKVKEAQLGTGKKDETLKIIALEKELKQKENALAQSQDDFTKRIASNEQTIKTLNEKIKLLETATPKTVVAKTSTPASKGHKPVMIDKVTCTDMGTGVNAISETCKKEVQIFLAKYDSSYLFEVAPIVDNGGFASLKLIKNKKVGVEDTEIDRISGLANIGLGKARAKAGGELVETYVGEGAKISYALSNIEQDKARGFQIRVYQ